MQRNSTLGRINDNDHSLSYFPPHLYVPLDTDIFYSRPICFHDQNAKWSSHCLSLLPISFSDGRREKKS